MINNNNPDTLSVFTMLLALSDIKVTEIRHSADDRKVTLVVTCTKEQSISNYIYANTETLRIMHPPRISLANRWYNAASNSHYW